MSRAPQLFVADSVMIDLVLPVGTLPASGGDVMASAALFTVGGGFNVMSAVRRQGLAVAYLAKVGTGPSSDLTISAFEHEGITHALTHRGTGDAGMCVVLVEPDGERTFITAPGAEMTVSAAELRAVSLVAGDVVYLSGYNFVYPELGASFGEWLDNLDEEVLIAFDPGPRVMDIAPPLRERVISRTDFLLLNESEATDLSGLLDLDEALENLSDRTRSHNVVLRTGASGCRAIFQQRRVQVDGFTVDVVDTNGAGDVHNGVMLAVLMQGGDIEEAMRRANAAAAIAIGQLGAASAPVASVIDDFMQKRLS
jgi:sugar/nucleoside kinase (ribokinase family)